MENFPRQDTLYFWVMPCYIIYKKKSVQECLLVFSLLFVEICSHAAGKALGTL